MKLLTVLDEKHWSQGAIDLGCYLSKLTRSKLTGVFPCYSNEQDIGVPPLSNDATAMFTGKPKIRVAENTINHFHQACLQQDVTSIIHRDRGIVGKDLETESLFADVVIVDAAISFSDGDDKVPSRVVTSLLSDAKCPIILASTTFEAIEEIIFAYDSTFSSLFAIKQFTYLFPQFRDRKVLVVGVTDGPALARSEKLDEWLNDNYTSVSFAALRGDGADRLLEIVISKHKALLVLGASERNSLSAFFKPGAADNVMKFANLPVFIARR